MAAQLSDFRGRVLSEGAMLVRPSYVVEAGNAALAGQRLTAADEALLARVTHPDGTLLQTFREWLDTARKLGDIETQRASLSPTSPSRDEVRALRTEWNKLAKVIRAAADTEKGLNEVGRKELFGLYDQEVSKHHAPAVADVVVAPATTPTPPAKPVA